MDFIAFLRVAILELVSNTGRIAPTTPPPRAMLMEFYA